MNIKEKIKNFKLGEKFKAEKNKLLKLFKNKKKNEPLALASTKWIEQNKKGNEFSTVRNFVTINKQKYEFWTTEDEQNKINPQENWTIINRENPFKNPLNKNSVSELSEKYCAPSIALKQYYSQRFIKINNAIILFLKKTDLNEIRETLEKTQD